jgi:circadian clock protein KaiC
MNTPDAHPPATLSTGVVGLDQIVGGGLPRNRLYLVEGGAGAGKTTLAFRFLVEGVRRNEPSLYVVTAETREEVAQAAASHGWTFDGIEVLELQSPAGEGGRTSSTPSSTRPRCSSTRSPNCCSRRWTG